MAGARDALNSPIRTAEILAIGSELLTPHRLDTNSLFLTGQLNDLGVDVISKSVVGDDTATLAEHLRQALARADLVITTGGLGPTSDDLTREVVADVLGLSLAEDPDVLAAISRRFERRGLRMPEINRRQAAVPGAATVLPNPKGTAPGLMIMAGDRLVVLLPGPPREMQPMFQSAVAPAIAARSSGRRVWRRVIKIAGRPESHVEEIAHPIYAPLAAGDVPIETTILASPGIIELHLSARGNDEPAIVRQLDAAVAALAAALGEPVFSVDGRSLEEVVGASLAARGWTIAVAESCTGGLVTGRLTEVPGSSAWVIGSVVAYANDVKIKALGVPAAMIEAHGAVSEPVALAMAEGARTAMRTNVGVSVTGIAGPTGGTAEKPVGTVVIAVATPDGAGARTLHLTGDRQMVRHQSVIGALDLVRRSLDGRIDLAKDPLKYAQR